MDIFIFVMRAQLPASNFAGSSLILQHRR